MKPPVKQGERAWVVVPVSGAWEAVKITTAPAIDVTDEAVVVAQGDKRYLVPGAFVARAVPAAALGKGDPVMASAKGTRVYGRIVDAGPIKAHVRYKFAGSVTVDEIATDDIVEVDGSGFLGAPLSLKDSKTDGSAKGPRVAQLIHLGKERAWVILGGRPHSVAPGDVTVLPVPPLFAKGAPIFAAKADAFAPGVVFDVLDEGLQYTVKWDGGEDTTTSTFEQVIPRK